MNNFDTCELCGGNIHTIESFGDVTLPRFFCGVCMGWTGKRPKPEVIDFLKKHGEWTEPIRCVFLCCGQTYSYTTHMDESQEFAERNRVVEIYHELDTVNWSKPIKHYTLAEQMSAWSQVSEWIAWMETEEEMDGNDEDPEGADCPHGRFMEEDCPDCGREAKEHADSQLPEGDVDYDEEDRRAYNEELNRQLKRPSEY